MTSGATAAATTAPPNTGTFPPGPVIFAGSATLGIERPVVLGSSFGGFVALTYAALFPDNPGAVILTNTTGGRTNYTRSVEVFRRLGGDQAADVAARDFAEHTEESAAAFDRICYPLFSARPGYVQEAA